RLNHGNQAMAAANLAQDMIAQGLKGGMFARHDYPTVGEVLKKLGLNRKQALDNISHKAINHSGLELTPDNIARMHIDPRVADDVLRVMKPFSAPEEVGAVLRTIDALTDWFRGSVTAIFPAFHVRNFISGQVQNFLGGAWSARSLHAADRLVRGKKIEWAGEIPGLSANAAEATDPIRQLAFQHALAGHQGQSYDIAAAFRSTVTAQMPRLYPRSEIILRSLLK